MNRFFDDTEDSLPVLLQRARETIMAQLRPTLASHDLSETQWRVLRVLSEQGPLEPTRLGASASILTPSLTRILAALDKRGLIRRANHDTDKRKQVIVLTDDGAALLTQIAPEASAIYAQLERDFGRPQLNNLMNKLRRIADMKPG